MRVTLHSGRIDLTSPVQPQVRLRGLRPEVVYWSGASPRTWRPLLRAANDGFTSETSAVPLSIHIATDTHTDALIVRATVQNTGSEPIRMQRVAPLALGPSGECTIGARTECWSIFRQGYQSWTGTRSFRTREVDRDPWSDLLKVGLIDLRNPSPAQPGHFRSDMFAAIKNLDSGEALVAGFLTCRDAFGGIEFHVDGTRCTRWAAGFDCDDLKLAAGASCIVEPLWLAAGADEHALLAAYADAAGAAMQARVAARNPVGWCSWYYYFTRISEARILENLTILKQMRDRFPCDYVQIDDGYQAAIGDWLTPNDKFPRGMGAVAEQIRGAGFDAGIWTAPFIAKSDSHLFTEHPEWFVRNERGAPRFALWNPMWGFGNCYALDTTHPAVIEWLQQTFRVIVQEWGYRVLKLDFLYAAALPGQRYDAQATRAQALRRGLTAIREAAGSDAFLLGCGCPLGPAIGIVDAMRIGPDVAPFWSNFVSRVLQGDQHGLATKHAIRNTLTRAFLHRRWWLNDPDCLMVRDTKTQLTPDEVRTLATVIAATDGMIVLSDRVEQLSAERLTLLDRTLQLAGGQPVVADLLSNDIPEVLLSRSPTQTVLAAFNFKDEPRRKLVDLRALAIPAADMPYAREWWSGGSVPIADGVANFGEIPPHACRVLVLPTGR